MSSGPMYDNAIERFDFDRWETVAAIELRPGDWIFVNNATHLLHDFPAVKDGKIVLNAVPVSDDQRPIKVMVGEYASDLNHVVMAMDYTNSALNEFGDGMAMIMDVEAGPAAVFSPRLEVSELEAFCKKNISRHEAHFNANAYALDRGEIIAMAPFWRDPSDS